MASADIAVLPAERVSGVVIARLAEKLRPEDRLEMWRLGHTGGAEEAIWAEILGSDDAYIAVAGVEPIAAWGIRCSDPLAMIGQPWLWTTEGFRRHARRAVRIARIQMDTWAEVYSEMTVFVDAEYAGAQRLLHSLGFRLGDPHPMGEAGAKFRLARWRAA